ncbi:hypothetical protein Bb109J_c1576 [Bdellovibrio bacteriovorus]|nr:hypothetical protein Bb109J_c1576 [Bdellovibrio bacteriovorus]
MKKVFYIVCSLLGFDSLDVDSSHILEREFRKHFKR